MALKKRTSKRKKDPITGWAKSVGDYMIEELGIDSADTIAKVCQMLIDASGVNAEEDVDEEEEAPAIKKSSRRRKTTKKRSSKRDDNIGRVSLWENLGDGNYEFSGNIKFNFDGGNIRSDDDVDLQLSVMLFEPSDDSSYIYGGILTETVEGRKKSKKRPPIVGRIYVYDGGEGRESGMAAYAYCYIADDDSGDNTDPDYLLDYLPEELIPEKGAFCKLLIYENDSDSEKAPIYTGTATLPEKLNKDDDEDEEEEEAPRRRRRSKRTSRRKAEATTTAKRRRPKGRRRSTVNVLNFSSTDMPDVYDDEEDEEEYDD